MLVGRTAELARADALLAALLDGQGSQLLVVGAPGMGRTALLDVVARRARGRGVRVVRMRAVRRKPAVNHTLVVDLLRVLGADHHGLESASGLADALVAALDATVSRGPALLLVDDLHDADSASVEALASTVDRCLDVGVAAIVTTRPCTAVERRLATWPWLSLGPVDPDASLALVRAELGMGADDAVVEELVRRLGGHPLALVESARSLEPEQVAGRALLPEPLPVGPVLDLAWADRIDAVPEPVRRLVACLAVVDVEHPDLLAAVLSRAGCGAADLDEAESAGLVVALASQGPRLAAPVIGEVALARVPPGERHRLHLLAAQTAADLDLDPVVVLDHLRRTGGVPDADAADLLWAQADRPAARDQPPLRAAIQELAVRLTPDPAARSAGALLAVRSWVEAGLDARRGARLIELVGSGPLSPDDAARLAWLNASAQDDLPTQLAEVRRAIATHRDSAPAQLPGLLWDAAGLSWAIGDAAAGMQAVSDLLALPDTEMSDGLPFPPWLRTALHAAALLQLGRVADSVPLRRAALAQADDLDPATAPVLALLDAVFLDDLLLADTPGAHERLAAVVTRTSRPGLDPVTCLWGIQAWRARSRGDWGRARQLLDDGLGVVAGCRDPGSTAGMLALSVELAALTGDRVRLEHDASLLRSLAGGLSDRRRLIVLERALGMDALAAGDLDAALVHLREAADVDFLGRGLRDAVLSSRVDAVEALLRLGDRDEARARYERLRPLLLALEEPLADAWQARTAALLAEDDDAKDAFERALAAHRRTRDPFEEGRTELLYGERLRRARSRVAAREHLLRAQCLFAQVGAAPWLERASRELRAAGGGDRATASTGVSAVSAHLTSQERIVAEAVAGGRSTREAADLLVLSPRTVESHLSHVYRKLGIRGRAALASAMAAADYGPDDVHAR